MTPHDELLAPRDDFDRLLAAWFEADAPRRAPDAIADAAIDRTAGARQRLRWLPFGRWPAMQTTLRLPVALPAARAALLVILGLLLAAALVAFAIAAGSAHRPPSPFGPAATGLVAFDSGGDIYVANPDGSGRRALTSGPSDDYGPVWSLDGEHLAYFSEATPDATAVSIVAVDAAGGNPWVVATPATNTFSSLSWSPDGHRLAYIDNVQATPSGWADVGDLAIADLSTRTTHTITHGLAASDPAWAPDGNRIAFKESTDFSVGVSQLDLVPVDGGAPTRLSDLSSDNAGFSSMQWSPDGKRLLVWAGTPNHDVFVVDAATGAARNMTNTPDADEFWATWSNDGTRIAYETFATPPGAIDVVHVLTADGRSDRALPNAHVTGSTLLWSPDDKFLIGFDSDGTASANVVLIPVDGSPPTEIPAPSNSITGSFQRR